MSGLVGRYYRVLWFYSMPPAERSEAFFVCDPIVSRGFTASTPHHLSEAGIGSPSAPIPLLWEGIPDDRLPSLSVFQRTNRLCDSDVSEKAGIND